MHSKSNRTARRMARRPTLTPSQIVLAIYRLSEPERLELVERIERIREHRAEADRRKAGKPIRLTAVTREEFCSQ